jgi:hypothetical protein
MGDILIEYGPEGFDCAENDESLPAWVPKADEVVEQAEQIGNNHGTL